MSPSKKLKFTEGERILCYQDAHIYEAKCVKMKKSGSTQKYLVHYHGWKSRYDEWVTIDRILKYNKDNLALKQKLRAKSKDSFKKVNKEKKKQSSADLKKLKVEKKKLASLNSAVNPLKEFITNEISTPAFVESSDEFLNKREVKILIPDDLNIVLTDDWEFITTQNKLIYLPSKTTIDKILNDYYQYKTLKMTEKNTIDLYAEFLLGIRKYFNFLLDKCLLYEAEKPQLEYLINNYEKLTSVVVAETSSKDSKKDKKKSKKHSNGKRPEQPQIQQQLSFVIEDEMDPSTTVNGESSSADSTKDNLIEVEAAATESGIIDSKPANPEMSKAKKVYFTKLYGPVHLLRLFTKLGQFLFYTDLTGDRLATLNTYIKDFLNYLVKNLSLFNNDSDTSYVDASLLNLDCESIS